jgi:hypothetical protein
VLAARWTRALQCGMPRLSRAVMLERGAVGLMGQKLGVGLRLAAWVVAYSVQLYAALVTILGASALASLGAWALDRRPLSIGLMIAAGAAATALIVIFVIRRAAAQASWMASGAACLRAEYVYRIDSDEYLTAFTDHSAVPQGHSPRCHPYRASLPLEWHGRGTITGSPQHRPSPCWSSHQRS